MKLKDFLNLLGLKDDTELEGISTEMGDKLNKSGSPDKPDKQDKEGESGDQNADNTETESNQHDGLSDNGGDESNKQSKEDEGNGRSVSMFKDGWFKDGRVNYDLIEDEEVKEAFKSVLDKINADAMEASHSRAIDDAVNKLNLAVKPDTFKKMLNADALKFDDSNKITNFDEVVAELKKGEPSLFKVDSNPLSEGFNPIERVNTSSDISFEDAYNWDSQYYD